jgi:hypothetical protein
LRDINILGLPPSDADITQSPRRDALPFTSIIHPWPSLPCKVFVESDSEEECYCYVYDLLVQGLPSSIHQG